MFHILLILHNNLLYGTKFHIVIFYLANLKDF